jgi:hypothetical protein
MATATSARTPLLQVVKRRSAAWRAQLGRLDQACHHQVDQFMREAASEPVYGAEALQALWLVQELLGAGMVEEARELLQMRFPGTIDSRQPLAELRVGGSKRKSAARRAAPGAPVVANDTVETLRKSRPRVKQLLLRIMAARARALNARHRAVDPSVVYSHRSSSLRSPSSAARDMERSSAERSDVRRWTSRAGGNAIPEWGAQPRAFAPSATSAETRVSTREALSRMADARARAMADARAEVQARRSPTRSRDVVQERLASPPGQARAVPPQPQPQHQHAHAHAHARRAAPLASLLPSPFAAPAAAAAEEAVSVAGRASVATASKADVKRQVQDMLKQRLAQRFRAAASGGSGGDTRAPAATPLPAAVAVGGGDVRASIRAQVEARLAARRRR